MKVHTQCVCFIGSLELRIERSGCKLILEESGFVIDYDDVLKFEVGKGSVLIIQRPGERWEPAGGISILTRREHCDYNLFLIIKKLTRFIKRVRPMITTKPQICVASVIGFGYNSFYYIQAPLH